MAAAEQLTELFKKAQGAAERATSEEEPVDAEEARCVEALQAMRSLPVTTALLMSTQIGKQLRKLTKHPRPKIRSTAADILEAWKKIVASEATSKNGDVKVKSPKPGAAKMDTKGKFEASSDTSNSRAPQNNGPAKLKALPKCNDESRDMIRKTLLEAFSKVWQEAGPDDLRVVNTCDPVQVAVDVENSLYANLGSSKGDKKARYRSILFNMKDANNPDLRRRVLLGEIPPFELATMSAEDMASDERKRKNKQIKDKAMFECQRGMQQEATTDQFKCGKCGQRKCTYFQKQIRSADEPMTTFVTCVNCYNRWKFC